MNSLNSKYSEGSTSCTSNPTICKMVKPQTSSDVFHNC